MSVFIQRTYLFSVADSSLFLWFFFFFFLLLFLYLKLDIFYLKLDIFLLETGHTLKNRAEKKRLACGNHQKKQLVTLYTKAVSNLADISNQRYKLLYVILLFQTDIFGLAVSCFFFPPPPLLSPSPFLSYIQ